MKKSKLYIKKIIIKSKKHYGIIYCAENKINKKKYIGQTILSLEKRKAKHEKRSKSIYPFHRALIKYGNDAFIWSVLKKCKSLNDLNKKEIYFIKKFKIREFGYNLAPGGNGFIPEKHSKKHSIRSREKISLAVQKSLKNPITKLRKAIATKRYWLKPESHEKLSKAIKKLWQNKDYQDKITRSQSERFKKLWQTDDYRMKQAELHKQRWLNKADAEKMLRGFKTQFKDPKNREKQSKRLKEYWIRKKGKIE